MMRDCLYSPSERDESPAQARSAAMTGEPTAATLGPDAAADVLGARIRQAREATGLSLREVARRVQVSPSFVSQVERGKANPSVGTLYALVSVLGTSVDELMGDQDAAPGRNRMAPTGQPRAASGSDGRTAWSRVEVPVQRAEGRRRVQMSGVTWERLTHDDDPFVDFLEVVYQPGSMSCPPDDMMRHGGREYGHVKSGVLQVQVGFDTYSLGPGDSIHFDSMTPHRLSNPYEESCTAIWVVLARRDSHSAAGADTENSAHLPGLL
jgi:transcriptional regulator with XRE-family HTH domain